MYPAPSASRLQSLLGQSTSNSSVMDLGGEILLLEVLPKKASTSSFAAAVVTEGARIDPLRELTAPL